MSRFALLLAILGLVAFALPATSFADHHEGEADVSASAEDTGEEAAEGEAEAEEGADVAASAEDTGEEAAAEGEVEAEEGAAEAEADPE